MRLRLVSCAVEKVPRGGAYGSRRGSADRGEAGPTEEKYKTGRRFLAELRQAPFEWQRP